MGEREIVSRMPDRSVVRYRYGNFAKRALRLAEALSRTGLKKGDWVATLAWNHSSHLEAYFGIPLAEASSTPSTSGSTPTSWPGLPTMRRIAS